MMPPPERASCLGGGSLGGMLDYPVGLRSIAAANRHLWLPASVDRCSSPFCSAPRATLPLARSKAALGGRCAVTLARRWTQTARPEAARLGAYDSGTTVTGTVVHCAFLGSLVHLAVSLAPGIEFSFHLPAMASLPRSGTPVTVTLDPEAIICLSTSSTI